jgi:TolB-like protein/Tfp pilus assembly protein PilF
MVRSFLSELRHRKVLRTAMGYALLTAAAVEFTDIITPILGLPDGVLPAVIKIALVGFPIVVVLSWFFDLESGSVVRGTASPGPVAASGTNIISILLIGVLGIAVAYLSYRLYGESQDPLELAHGKSIAVLPFASIAAEEDAETAYFSDGVAEEILNALSKVEGLRVAARTSSFTFRDSSAREVGEALNVSVMLEGTVRRAGDNLRLSVSLVDTADGFQLWSKIYDHELKDLFVVQEQIAHAIVAALEIELLGDTATVLVSPGTNSTAAYDKYLAGRSKLQVGTPSAVREAIALFEQALEIDPDYAQAYAGLADSWISLREVGNLTLLDATQRSHAAITKALVLNNALPEAQASLGLCILGGGLSAQAALQFQKAIDLDPEYSDGYLLRANLLRDQGYLSEATRVYSQALALDPLNSAILENQALLLARQGRFNDALEQLADLEQRNPDRPTGALAASRVWSLSGNKDKALQWAEHAVELAPQSPVALAALLDGHLHLGNTEAARSIYDRMNALAPNNELVLTSSMRFHMMVGDFEALDQLVSPQLKGIMDSEAYSGTAILFDRARWGAIALLGLNDPQGARQLLEKGIPDLDQLDPRPETIRTLALLARARSLDGDAAGAADIISVANRVTDIARSEGWDRGQLGYAAACIAAARGAAEQAVVHLEEAVDAGWNDFALADHDPVLADVVQLPAYQTLRNGT